jgi:hypothetical protein
MTASVTKSSRTYRVQAAVSGYTRAAEFVTRAGYHEDIDWAYSLQSVKPDAQYVLREGAWVIVNSGFRFQVAKKIWPDLLEAFHDFEPEKVWSPCREPALQILRHPGKIDAILKLAETVRAGIDPIMEDAKTPTKLTRLPYIGKVTCWHFAKVLGIDCVKPDVHLQRAAEAADYDEPLGLCQAVKTEIGDPLTVIDSIFWRYGEQRETRGWPTWRAIFGREPRE